MFLTHKPTEAELDSFLSKQSQLNVQYSGVEMTRPGKVAEDIYRQHVVKTALGVGENTFNTAVRSMKEWRNFALNWILLYPGKPQIAPGTTLVVCANHGLLWSVNACRIIFVIDELTGAKKQFGFSYGTLPGHVEQGEERFLLEWDTDSDQVTYEILAYSKSNHLLVSVLWPIAALIQDQFRKDSIKALTHAVDLGDNNA